MEDRKAGAVGRPRTTDPRPRLWAHLANAQALTFDLRDDPPPDPQTLRARLARIAQEQYAAQQAAQEL